MANKDLINLLEAEGRYLRDAGWRLSRDVALPNTKFTLWVSPHNGDEYAQSSAVKMQKIEDGYLPRPEPQAPASEL